MSNDKSGFLELRECTHYEPEVQQMDLTSIRVGWDMCLSTEILESIVVFFAIKSKFSK